MVAISPKKLLAALSAGLEVSMMTFIGALAGFAIGGGFGELGRNIGILLGAMGGFAMGIKHIIEISAPPPHDEG